MSVNIEEVLAVKSVEEWALLVAEYTTTALKVLLGREKLPTLDELLRVGWDDTKNAGVYGHIITTEAPGHHNHVYVGSASHWDKGLRKRRQDHEKLNQPNYHHHIARQPFRHGRFVTLMQIPWNDNTAVDIRPIRLLCLLGEAVWTSWIGGFSEIHVSSDLLSLFPYDRLHLSWRGLCTHSCLIEGLRTPIDNARRLERNRERRAERRAQMTPEQVAAEIVQQTQYWRDWDKKRKSTWKAKDFAKNRRSLADATARWRSAHREEHQVAKASWSQDQLRKWRDIKRDEMRGLRARYPNRYKEIKDWWSKDRVAKYKARKAERNRRLAARKRRGEVTSKPEVDAAEVLEARLAAARLASRRRQKKYQARKKVGEGRH
ncbi:MAG: hypothetical protein M1833_001308 [Piccolia ochrophora]|nr:MAG: hypothetical protein M1833_001308 [Piccolia ochrophora]